MRLRFWFDVVCPFAMLASTRVAALAAEAGAELQWRPILLGGVLKALGQPDRPMDAMPPGKAALTRLDMLRQADLLGVPLRVPDAHPRRTVDAMRLLVAAPPERVPALAADLFRAYWVDGRDLADRAVLRALAAPHGLDADRVCDDPAVKAALRAATDEAVSRGVFGVPTFEVGERRIWGADRLHLLREALGLPPGPPGGLPPPNPRPGATLEWFHDFSSPFSYLGSTQVARLAAEAGATLIRTPILLGALFREIGTPMVPLHAMSPARRAWQRADLDDWARTWGVPFRFASTFPLRSVTALRVALVEPRATDALYRAAWVEDLDLGLPQVVAGVLDRAGFDGGALVAATEAPAVKDRLRENTERARALGVCGVPSFLVDGRDLFWGQDRLPQVAHALAGWKVQG